MQTNTSSPFRPPSAMSIARRLVNFAVTVTIALLILYLWLHNVLKDQQQGQRQAQQLGVTISAQNARLLAHALIATDTDRLRQQLDVLQQDPHVHSVALYDAYGQQVMASDGEQPTVDLFSPEQDPALIVFVEDVFSDDTHLGYLKVTLWRERVLRHYQEFQEELLIQAGILVVIALLAGVTLTRVYYKLFSRPEKIA